MTVCKPNHQDTHGVFWYIPDHRVGTNYDVRDPKPRGFGLQMRAGNGRNPEPYPTLAIGAAPKVAAKHIEEERRRVVPEKWMSQRGFILSARRPSSSSGLFRSFAYEPVGPPEKRSAFLKGGSGLYTQRTDTFGPLSVRPGDFESDVRQARADAQESKRRMVSQRPFSATTTRKSSFPFDDATYCHAPSAAPRPFHQRPSSGMAPRRSQDTKPGSEQRPAWKHSNTHSQPFNAQHMSLGSDPLQERLARAKAIEKNLRPSNKPMHYWPVQRTLPTGCSKC